MSLLAQAFYTIAPVTMGGILHMVIVSQGLLPGLAIPIDGQRTWRGHRIFGDHKTWRGLLVILGATLLFTLAQAALEWLLPSLRSWNLVDLQAVGPARVGLIWGLGYAIPELPNSFVKRQLEISEGQATSGIKGILQILMDQADSAIGCGLVAWWFLAMPASQSVTLILLCTGMHLALNFIMGLTGLRKRKI